MYSKTIALVFLSFFTILAAASPNPWATTTVTVTATPTATTISQCNTGGAQCCNTVLSAGSSPVGLLLGLLGIVLQDLNLLVGLGCTTLIGVGPTCSQQPVCCTNNNFNGLINIGCVPITL